MSKDNDKEKITVQEWAARILKKFDGLRLVYHTGKWYFYQRYEGWLEIPEEAAHVMITRFLQTNVQYGNVTDWGVKDVMVNIRASVYIASFGGDFPIRAKR